MYVGGMSEDHLGQLATMTQLKMFSLASVVVLGLIMIGTWSGNSDLWDKAGDEMGRLNKLVKKAAWASIGWIPQLYLNLQARNLGIQDDGYMGRHRLA